MQSFCFLLAREKKRPARSEKYGEESSLSSRILRIAPTGDAEAFPVQNDMKFTCSHEPKFRSSLFKGSRGAGAEPLVSLS